LGIDLENRSSFIMAETIREQVSAGKNLSEE
jgi:hypothetical protein